MRIFHQSFLSSDGLESTSLHFDKDKSAPVSNRNDNIKKTKNIISNDKKNHFPQTEIKEDQSNGWITVRGKKKKKEIISIIFQRIKILAIMFLVYVRHHPETWSVKVVLINA